MILIKCHVALHRFKISVPEAELFLLWIYSWCVQSSHLFRGHCTRSFVACQYTFKQSSVLIGFLPVSLLTAKWPDQTLIYLDLGHQLVFNWILALGLLQTLHCQFSLLQLKTVFSPVDLTLWKLILILIFATISHTKKVSCYLLQ